MQVKLTSTRETGDADLNPKATMTSSAACHGFPGEKNAGEQSQTFPGCYTKWKGVEGGRREGGGRGGEGGGDALKQFNIFLHLERDGT